MIMINRFNENDQLKVTFMSINIVKIMINTCRFNENDPEVHNNDQ